MSLQCVHSLCSEYLNCILVSDSSSQAVVCLEPFLLANTMITKTILKLVAPASQLNNPAGFRGADFLQPSDERSCWSTDASRRGQQVEEATDKVRHLGLSLTTICMLCMYSMTSPFFCQMFVVCLPLHRPSFKRLRRTIERSVVSGDADFTVALSSLHVVRQVG